MATDDPGEEEAQEVYHLEHIERVRPGQRRLIAAIISVAGLSAFAAIVWYAFSEGKRVGSEGIAPLIVADGGPVKVRPEKPGGMAVPHRDKTVYSRIAPGEAERKVERLLPPPEVPLPQRIAPPPAPPSPVSAPKQAKAVEAQAPKPPVTAKATEKAALPKVEVLTAPAKPKPIVTTKPPVAPKNAEKASGVPAVPPKAALPKAEAPTAAAKPPASPKPSAPAKPAPARPAPAAAKEKSTGRFLIQVASLRSPVAARSAWERIKRDHAVLLGKLAPDIVRVDLGAKGVWYRVRAGGLADAAAARRLCARLKARKQPCLVARP